MTPDTESAGWPSSPGLAPGSLGPPHPSGARSTGSGKCTTVWCQCVWPESARGEVVSVTGCSSQNRGENSTSNHRAMPYTHTGPSCPWRAYSSKGASKSSSSLVTVTRSSVCSCHGAVTTSSFLAPDHCARPTPERCATRPMQLRSKPCTSSQKSAPPHAGRETPATWMCARSGRTAPPGRRKRSRASRTVSSMHSYSRQKPIHSLTSTSALPSSPSSGISPICSSLPVTTSTTPGRKAVPLLAPTTVRATSAMKGEPSTPTTRDAPARAANMDRMPVPHPTSSTTAPATRPGFRSSAAR
mmetsp:Transcript_9211/g.31999  ORF Transcript_9211/g.31999 Transcript_9211/m.31999 type:complete len:300 (+) Transcript_9211:286-1185(+)